MMIDYAKALGASNEVIEWCEAVLAARQKKVGVDQAEAEHILDYLVSDSAPTRLRKMSYTQAKANTEKWVKANQKKGRHLIDDPDDIETVHDFLDGTLIVKLLTKKAYQREGFFMAHCVGAYDTSRATVYSYRDENNIPHATFDLKKTNDQMVQIKGKGNGPIHPKYITPILTFLKTVNIEVRPQEMKYLGYHHVTKEAEKLMSLFVDTLGEPAKLVHLFGHNYLCAG